MVLSDEVRARINTIKQHTDPMTQAQLVTELMRDIKIKNVDLARELGIKPSYLSHLIRVMRLPDMVTDGYWSKQLSFTHLILISRLKKPEDIVSLYDEILRDSLNVSAVERRVREILYLIDSRGMYIPHDRLRTLQTRIESSLGQDAKVTIIQTRIKSKILIEVAGNLIKTSSFIEQFASKYRQSRKKDKTEAQPVVLAESAEDHTSDRTDTVGEVGGDLTGTNRVQDAGEEKQGVTKYRFDPDF